MSVTKNEKQIMNASNNNENLGIMKSFIIKVYFYNPYIISFLCMMALMPIWISIPEKYNPFYFFALPTGAVFFFAALELLKGRVEITFSDSDMKITYLKNDRFYKRKDTHIEINEIKEIEFYNYNGYDIMTIILKDKGKIRLKRHSFVFDDYEKLKYYINSLQNFSSFEM